MTVVTADSETIQLASERLRAGQLVAFPTETVYGLGADATNPHAVAQIFAAKNRPQFNPLIIHVPDLASALQHGEFNDDARRLAEQFWPGALTLVVPLMPQSDIADLVTSGLDSIAIRVPDHSLARSLLRSTGRPLAAPSANRSGTVSPTLAEHVAQDLADAAPLILDGGATRLGIESTIIGTLKGRTSILRPGAIPRQDLESALGRQITAFTSGSDRPSSPGQMQSHYAPNAALRLHARETQLGEALLAFGPSPPAHDGPVINLSQSGDLVEAAANLFSALRQLDTTNCTAIAVMPIPSSGLGEAINDRLRRAAAPRRWAPF